MKILQYPDPRLAQKCPLVRFPIGRRHRRLINEMLKLLPGAGAGLAANQVGSQYRICVFNYEALPPYMINPVIWKSPETFGVQEACLSIDEGKTFFNTVRSKTIEVTFCDANGVRYAGEYSGGAAVVIQHEIDHLDGKLINGTPS